MLHDGPRPGATAGVAQCVAGVATRGRAAHARPVAACADDMAGAARGARGRAIKPYMFELEFRSAKNQAASASGPKWLCLH